MERNKMQKSQVNETKLIKQAKIFKLTFGKDRINYIKSISFLFNQINNIKVDNAEFLSNILIKFPENFHFVLSTLTLLKQYGEIYQQLFLRIEIVYEINLICRAYQFIDFTINHVLGKKIIKNAKLVLDARRNLANLTLLLLHKQLLQYAKRYFAHTGSHEVCCFFKPIFSQIKIIEQISDCIEKQKKKLAIVRQIISEIWIRPYGQEQCQ